MTEESYLELCQMRVSYKFAQLNFDSKKLFEALGLKDKTKVKFSALLEALRDSLKVYLSQQEKESLRNALFP